MIDNNSTSKITQSVKLDSVELHVPSIQLTLNGTNNQSPTENYR